jgi:hypothetical protein
MTMEISGLGPVTRDDEFGWYQSQPIAVPVLGGQMCRIIVEGYDDDPDPEDSTRRSRTSCRPIRGPSFSVFRTLNESDAV